MAIGVNSLTEHFAAEISGVDLSVPIDDEDFATIKEAFDEHSILVFHDQELNDDRQILFSERFGALEVTINANPGGAGTVVTILSNVDDNGDVISPEDRRMVFNTGNQMWHTDSSYKRVPAMASLLSGRDVPSDGGETEFASMRAAYAALPDKRQAELEPLVCVHDFAYSRGLIDPNLLSERDKRELPPVRQAMIRINPTNGCKNLFVGAHASYVEGMALLEGRSLIRELNAHVTKSEFVYRHVWRKNDLVMWDNRCALHRGRPWNAVYPRVMRRTTVQGEGETA